MARNKKSTSMLELTYPSDRQTKDRKRDEKQTTKEDRLRQAGTTTHAKLNEDH